MASDDTSQPGPLAGLTVLDLTLALAVAVQEVIRHVEVEPAAVRDPSADGPEAVRTRVVKSGRELAVPADRRVTPPPLGDFRVP